MRRISAHDLGRAVVGLLLLAGLMQCTAPPPTLEIIRDRGEVRVGTLNLPTTYYLGAEGPEGLEYELASGFAKLLGVNLVMTVYSDEAALREALRTGAADIAAAQLTYRGEWEEFASASIPYDQVGQLVVYRGGTKRPRTAEDLPGKRIVVAEGSPQAVRLTSFASTTGKPLAWTSLPIDATGGPLDELVRRRADVTIVDAPAFAFDRLAYPEVRAAFELADKRPVHWIVRSKSLALRAQIDAYLASVKETGQLAAMIARRAQPVRRMHFETARTFRRHIETRLPRYQPFFEEAAADTGVDWRLLAAMGYQESLWDEAAVSPNGARGIMMLMGPTAESVGVSDPHDARDNIHGGARYFLEVLGKIPGRIREPDRTWMALAAYNVGYGHLEDARVLTQMRGGNPDRWKDVRTNLPLLAQEGWYVQVKRGYARGWEPVQFVERVQQFLTVLEWRTQPPIEMVYQTESEDAAPLVVSADRSPT